MSSPRTPGVLVDQRFELVTRMDDRGYGESWKALDRRFKNRLVMLKFLRPVRGVELPEELSDHINTLRALKHGNVLATVGHGLHQGSPFLVHEHFEGRSLGAGLDGARETGVLLPVRLLEGLFAMVSAAISAAHRGAKSVVHGGLNPGCVVIHRLPGEDFQVRVLDFGLHRFADPDPSAPARSARALLSLAPEQFDGRPATEATDVFGLGALLREMVSTPPEMGATMAPTTMNRRREDVPAAVWEAAGVALQPDPSQRFATVEGFLAEVQRAWQQSIEAAPRSRIRRPRRPRRGRSSRPSTTSPCRQGPPRGRSRRSLPPRCHRPSEMGQRCRCRRSHRLRRRLRRLRSDRWWCVPSRTTPPRWRSPICPRIATRGTWRSIRRSSARRRRVRARWTT
ncbi:MAG: protein kinase [Deltaproteobacteria bacterium]|nr:protein kinase [Deltaproteobacteria bacterium]